MKYTKEILEAAAERSDSVTGVLRALNVPVTGGMQAHIKRRLVHFDIDISHFRWQRRSGTVPFGVTREVLEDTVRRSISIRGVLDKFGLSPSGGNYTALNRYLVRSNIDISHFKGQGHNRGKALPRIPAERILVRRGANASRERPRMLRRALREVGIPYRCAECGLPAQWRGKPIVLHVDHIDGDYRDCRRHNLRFLCPNCHTQTWNYAGKAKRRSDPI